ncbi:MAG: nucleotidyltransferase [Planctomycetota bacterium]|nr:nucleotidyltransferase [Planctomycetota bacterium]
MGPRDLMIVAARALNAAGSRYAVTGSMAAMMYGELRTTTDIDIVVDFGYRELSAVLQAFPESEFYVNRDAILAAMNNCGQFNVIAMGTDLEIDFMVVNDDFYNTVRLERARVIEVLPHEPVRFSAPEDVILKKLQFYQQGESDKHLRDVASMIKVSGEDMDREYLDSWASKLGVAGEWLEMKRRCGWV